MTAVVTPEPRSATPDRRPVAVTAVLVAAVLLVVSHIYLTIPLVPEVAAEYGTTVTAAAWIGIAFGLTFAFGNLVFPTVSDYVDPRRVMAFGLVAVAATSLVAGLAPNLPTLVGARTVQGFLAPALPPVALAYLPRVLPDRARATGLAVLSSCFLLAGIVGQAWALMVESAAGWRWVLWGMAPLLVAAALPVLRLPAVARPAATPSLGHALRTLAALLRRPQILVAYTGALTILLTFVGMYVALQTFSEQLGTVDPVTGLLVRLPGLPGITLGLFAGAFIRRWGPHRTGSAAFLVAALGLGIEATGGPLWLTLAGSAVFVAGLAVAIPAAVTLVSLASGAARGSGMAGYAFLIGAGAFVGPLLAQALAGLGFAATCAVLGAILLLPAGTFAAARRAVGADG